jgi:hypothetical protein
MRGGTHKRASRDDGLWRDPRNTIGKLELERGLPTKESVAKLFEAQEFQRATQAYIWGLPLVGMAEWQRAHYEIFGAKDGDIVIYANYRDKLGILTANNTTPYLITFVNLDRTGPFVVDLPAGPNASSILDFWQRSVTDMGQTGPDEGKGGKYLVIGPGQSEPADIAGYIVVRRPQRIYGRASALSILILPRRNNGSIKLASIRTARGPIRPNRDFSLRGEKSGHSRNLAASHIGSVSPTSSIKNPYKSATGS